LKVKGGVELAADGVLCPLPASGLPVGLGVAGAAAAVSAAAVDAAALAAAAALVDPLGRPAFFTSSVPW
jgi:hypothetical protein